MLTLVEPALKSVERSIVQGQSDAEGQNR